MARGVGGFASGLSRGIRTGMEMRQFKREEDEYNFQKEQRDEYQDIMQGIPTKGDLNTIAPVEGMNEGGYAIPAETFVGDQPQMQHGQQQIEKMRQRINNIVDPGMRDSALAELNRAQLGAASMAITAAVSSKDPNEKKRWLNQAYGFTGAPGDAPFVIGEDGAVTHNIPELVDEEGNPMPIDLVLGGLVNMVKDEPEKIFEVMTAWREQREALAREDAAIKTQKEQFDAQLEIQQERNDLAAIANDQNAATDTALIELRRLGLEVDLAQTDAELARITAATTGLSAEALQDGIKEIRALEKDFLANYSGPGADVISANINQWRSAGATLLALNLGRAQPAQVIDVATRFMEDKLGVGEPVELDVFQTPQGPAVMWQDPFSDSTRIRIPFSMVAELHRAGRLEDDEFQKLRRVFLGEEDPAAGPGGPPAEDDIQAPLSYRAGEAVRGALAWDDPRKFHGRAIEGVARGITGAQQGLDGLQNFRRGARGLPLEEEEIGSPSYTGKVQRGQ